MTILNADGTNLDYSTFLGGDRQDHGRGIAFDGSSIYVAGWTQSDNFPTTAGAFDQSRGGSNDAFLAKFSSNGALAFATLLGGNGSETGNISLELDSSGSPYVTGTTGSTDFPTTAGAFQRNLAPSTTNSIFISKFNNSGSSLVYSTLLGGRGGHHTSGGIAVHESGSAFVGGLTSARDFPTTPGAFREDPVIFDESAFVAKLNPTGSALEYSTLLGGDDDHDEVMGIAVDDQGNAYVTAENVRGNQRSGVQDFPVINAFQEEGGGGLDGFVTKLSVAGDSLVFSTYLGGGPGRDEGLDLALDEDGNPFLVGQTTSLEFPVEEGAFQGERGGAGEVPIIDSPGTRRIGDAFLVKFDGRTGLPIFSTYFGGDAGDEARSVAVDAAGNAYLTGTTASDNFPTTPGVVDRGCGADGCSDTIDAFAAKFSSGGNLIYSTFVGGPGDDVGIALDVDADGNAFIFGESDSRGFAVSPTAAYGLPEGSNAFVIKLSPEADEFLYFAVLGGSGREPGGFGSIAVDGSGQAFIAGATSSDDFPITGGAFQSSPGGGPIPNTPDEGFVAKLNAAGDSLLYSTYLGGTSLERIHDLAIDSSGNAYLTGATASQDFPVTSGAFQDSRSVENRGFAGFVTKLNPTGTGLIYSTYLFSEEDPFFLPQTEIRTIALSPDGAAHVTGNANALSIFKSVNPVPGGGFRDDACSGAFVSSFAPNGRSLTFSSCLAGLDFVSTGQGIAVEADGSLTIAGSGENPSAALEAPSPLGIFHQGNLDAFVLKISPLSRRISPVEGMDQTTFVESNFATRLRVQITDLSGDGVNGVQVTFETPANGPSGTFGGSRTTSVTTSGGGFARAPVLRSNGETGSFRVTATAPNTAGVAVFDLRNLIGAPSALVSIEGTPQSTRVGNAFATRLKVRVSDAGGNGVPGLSVDFIAPDTGPSGLFSDSGASTTSATTGPDGIAQAANFTANLVASDYQVEATLNGLSSTFSLSNTPEDPANLTIQAGNNQSTAVDTNFETLLQVLATDAHGNPVPGQQVVFAAPDSGPSGVFPGETRTATVAADNSGIATAPVLTANLKTGDYQVTASLQDLSTAFSLSNSPGAPAQIIGTSGNDQSATVGTPFATRLRVVIEDAHGNEIPGLDVRFTAPDSGPSGTSPNGTPVTVGATNLSGAASAPVLTANLIAGSYHVVAGVDGLPDTAIFSLTNLPLAARTLSVVSAQATAGEVAEIPIRLSQGDSIQTVRFSLIYDDQFLTFEEALAGSLLNGHTLMVDSSSPGQLDLEVGSSESSSLKAGDGTLATLTFLIDPGAGDQETLLTLQGASATAVNGADQPLNSVPGALTIIAAPPTFPIPTLIFPQFSRGEAGGVENRSRIVLRDTSGQGDSGRIIFQDPQGGLIEEIPYSLPPWGTFDFLTAGVGPLLFGPVEVHSNRMAEPQGTAVTGRTEGTLVFELLERFVSVGAAPLRGEHQVFISRNELETTGIAVYNPNPEASATIDGILLDEAGLEQATVVLELQPSEQVALFVENPRLFEQFFQDRAIDFQGTLNLTVRDPEQASVLGLIQRADGALIAVETAPVAFSGVDESSLIKTDPELRLEGIRRMPSGKSGTAPATPTLIFPQFADGVAGGFKNRSRIVLRDTSGDGDSGRIFFRDSSGRLLEEIDYTLAPWGTFDFLTLGEEPLQFGPVEVRSNRIASAQQTQGSSQAGTEGTLVFELLGTFVSGGAAPLRSQHQVFVSRSFLETTGVAAYNPHPSRSVTLDALLLDHSGTEVERTTLTLQALEQVAVFVEDTRLFHPYFEDLEGGFQGTLNLIVRDGDQVSILGLIQRSNGALIAIDTASIAFGANPVPGLASLDPASAFAGSGPFTLRLIGNGFIASSQVLWNGEARATVFLGPQEIQATITEADISSEGQAGVSVGNPPPGGGAPPTHSPFRSINSSTRRRG